ncbi:hypothetical protein [Octadecabacter antarcticus]|uniref:hypothetical protein n=1 Tax=Octadecabacter antarcticus TaxID=1217908 RepID=UPI0002FF392B|nr:hypothetical protein [Octadecabacter antarcticus]
MAAQPRTNNYTKNMDDRNESTCKRFNGELRRMHLCDRRRWAGWAVLMATVGLFTVFSLNT